MALLECFEPLAKLLEARVVQTFSKPSRHLDLDLCRLLARVWRAKHRFKEVGIEHECVEIVLRKDQREALFQPRDFALLGNCQAICLPYDGVQSLPPRRVYLKPHYLPADLPYWTAKQTGQL